MNKFKTGLVRLLKGIVIGIAIILPGVSGSTLAVILGIYDDIIDALAGFDKHFKKSVLTMFPLAIGAGIGFLALWYPLIWIIENAPLPTIALFSGFIISGFPGFFAKIKGKVNVGRISLLVVSCLAAVSIGLFSVLLRVDSGYIFDHLSVWGCLVIFIVGAFIAAAIFIPGVSGTMLLLTIGFWSPISEAFKALLQFSDIWHNLLVMASFGLGMVVGLLAFSRFMKVALEKHNATAYFGIIGFVLGSIVSAFFNYDIVVEYAAYQNAGTLDYVLAGVLLLVGVAIGYLLVLYDKKHKKGETA
jgi:putative membrane protein